MSLTKELLSLVGLYQVLLSTACSHPVPISWCQFS